MGFSGEVCVHHATLKRTTYKRGNEREREKEKSREMLKTRLGKLHINLLIIATFLSSLLHYIGHKNSSLHRL